MTDPQMQSSAPLIEAYDLHKSFGQKHAVNGVSLSIYSGQIYGLVGPDGAGKTTLTRLLCGALHLDAGQVSLDGYDIQSQSNQAQEQIGYLAQRFSLYEELSVMENLQFFAEVRGMSASEWAPRSREILQFVDLLKFSERRAGQLSGGMKQKLGLALALVNRPKILLLDEPTTGVDPATRQDFWKLIIRLLGEENMAILVSTPYMDEAARCTHVGFMRAGKIISEGTPRELRARLADRILELAGEPQSLLLQYARNESEVRSVQRFGNRLHLTIEHNAHAALSARLRSAIENAGGRIDILQQIEPQLEDVFIALSEEET